MKQIAKNSLAMAVNFPFQFQSQFSRFSLHFLFSIVASKNIFEKSQSEKCVLINQRHLALFQRQSIYQVIMSED